MSVVRIECLHGDLVVCSRSIPTPRDSRTGKPVSAWMRCEKEARYVVVSRAPAGRESRRAVCCEHARSTSDRCAVPMPGERGLFT